MKSWVGACLALGLAGFVGAWVCLRTLLLPVVLLFICAGCEVSVSGVPSEPCATCAGKGVSAIDAKTLVVCVGLVACSAGASSERDGGTAPQKGPGVVDAVAAELAPDVVAVVDAGGAVDILPAAEVGGAVDAGGAVDVLPAVEVGGDALPICPLPPGGYRMVELCPDAGQCKRMEVDGGAAFPVCSRFVADAGAGEQVSGVYVPSCGLCPRGAL